MAKSKNMALAEHPYSRKQPPVAASAQKPMEWSENFQDLSSFCNFGSKMVDNFALQSGEQLDTPVITVNDGFDFGLRSSSRVSHENLEDPDPWDLNLQQQQPSYPQTSNVSQWETVNDWLTSSPNIIEIECDPPSKVDPEMDEKLSVVTAEELPLAETLMDPNDGSIKLNERDIKEETIDIVELLNKTSKTDSHNNNSSNHSNRMQYSQSLAGNNNIEATVSANSSSSNNSSSTSLERLPIEVVRTSTMKTAGTLGCNKNHRDLTSDSLRSIFRAEEPVINDQQPQLVSTGDGKVSTKSSLLLTVTKELPTNAPRRTDLIFSEVSSEYVLQEIKKEPEDEEEANTVVRGRYFKSPGKQVKKLKLDINSAKFLNTGNELTPTVAALAESLDTPDVLKPLFEESEPFSLIEFCEADDGAGISLPNVSDSPIVETKKPPSVDALHNYGEKKLATSYGRREGLPTIREEDISNQPSLRSLISSSKVPQKRLIVTRSPARKRRKTQFQNFESENSETSDNYVDNEDEDETFHLPLKTKTTRRQRTSSRSSTCTAISPGKRTISSSGIDSDQESIISNNDRYRELRDRNNEASKRSRMNRKSKEMEMKEKAVELEDLNRRLKARANKLEKLVETLRQGMIKLVSNKKN